MNQLYPTESFLQVLFVTGVLGGGAAWLTGRAIALTWRPLWHAIAYIMLLGCAVRFIHFALFEADLLVLPSYLADTTFLIVVGCASWQLARATQMVTQYRWLYRRTGPFTWRKRAADDKADRAA
jgi:Domain of unknown function (DUF6867)